MVLGHLLPSLSVTTFMPGIFFFLSRFSMSVTSVPFGPAAVQHRHCMYDSSRLILSHRLVPPSLLFFLSRAAHTYCLACTYIVWVFLRTFLSLTSFSNRGLSPHRTPVCLSPSTTVLDFASSAYVLPDPSTLDRAHDVRPTGACAGLGVTLGQTHLLADFLKSRRTPNTHSHPGVHQRKQT